MSDNESHTSLNDEYTRNGIEFCAWHTLVENDSLSLATLNYQNESQIIFASNDLSLEWPDIDHSEPMQLEAIFLSREKRAAVRFRFRDTRAFRILDEGGLLEMWEASDRVPRPAATTFRVRGHGWQNESPLVWAMLTDQEHYSYMIATDFFCLEVISGEIPDVSLMPAIVRSTSANDH